MPQITQSPLPKHAKVWPLVKPGDFLDGYVLKSPLTPRQAAAVGLTMPPWADALLKLRNRIVRPLGLKTDLEDSGENAIFPVTYEDADQLLLGTDDSHLNFRICILQQDGQIHMGTWVHRNNLLGRIYLALVMPFHVLIVRDSLRRIARHHPEIASPPPAQ